MKASITFSQALKIPRLYSTASSWKPIAPKFPLSCSREELESSGPCDNTAPEKARLWQRLARLTYCSSNKDRYPALQSLWHISCSREAGAILEPVSRDSDFRLYVTGEIPGIESQITGGFFRSHNLAYILPAPPDELRNTVVHECTHKLAQDVFRNRSDVPEDQKTELLDALMADKARIEQFSSRTDMPRTFNLFNQLAEAIILFPISQQDGSSPVADLRLLGEHTTNYPQEQFSAEHIARITELLYIAETHDRMLGDSSQTLLNHVKENLIPASYAFYRQHLLPAYQNYAPIAHLGPQIAHIAKDTARVFVEALLEEKSTRGKNSNPLTFMLTPDYHYHSAVPLIERGLVHPAPKPDALNTLLTRQEEAEIFQEALKNEARYAGKSGNTEALYTLTRETLTSHVERLAAGQPAGIIRR